MTIMAFRKEMRCDLIRSCWNGTTVAGVREFSAMWVQVKNPVDDGRSLVDKARETLSRTWCSFGNSAERNQI